MSLVALLAAMLATTGCITLTGPDGKPKVDSYQLGRTTTVVYLLEKDSLKPEQVEAIKTVYMVFEGTVLSLEDKNVDRLKEIVKEKVAKELKDKDKKYQILASELIEFYWGQITAKIDFDAISNEEAVAELVKFYRGTRAALDQWGSLKTGSP
jgi:hypothetical protein